MDLAAWLRGLGLEQYLPAFRDHDIDREVLHRLTAEDLRELGIVSIGHRRKLLDAIAALGAEEPAAMTGSPAVALPPAEAERRQLTVMFCDLVGSTALSARLDPEDLREVMAAYHRAVTQVVSRADGFVAKYMGDGILVYFGYPQAHEDDAERAVRAGLGVVTAIRALRVQSVALSARVGIATGLVVVGDLIGEGSARQQPVLMLFEDAHWIDPTSREALDLAVDRVSGLPILLIVTFRPEFLAPWLGQPQTTMLALNRLDRRDRTELVTRVAGGSALPAEIAAAIGEHADGVPLFVEELTKSVVEGGVPPTGIPTTLHDSLMARLDRLPSVRRVAQIGAAIGREFSYTLLRSVAGLRDDELQTSLSHLVASELVFRRGMPPDAVYSFKHALVQDAAYGSLLRNTRKRSHARIADALTSISPELADSQPEVMAQHYAEAGLAERSATLWGRAASRSVARSTLAEPAMQLQKGIDQLLLLPETADRQRRELESGAPLADPAPRQGPGGAADGRFLRSGSGVVGGVRMSPGVRPDPVWAIGLSRQPRRTAAGAASGAGFRAALPPAERRRGTRSGSSGLGSYADDRRGLCGIPRASGTGAVAL